jgi:hypothetical protein
MYRELFIRDFGLLGDALKRSLYSGTADGPLSECMRIAFAQNDLFTERMQRISIEAVVDYFLRRDILDKWTLPYSDRIVEKSDKVLVVMAGNIPLVGFHDFLTVMASGCKVVVKCSSKDKVLLPFIVNLLCEINNYWNNRISFISGIETNVDIVIATGSDKTARFFRRRFADLPILTRGSRYSVAILYGDESDQELESLSKDIFYYYGLGCRSVSLLFVPEGYDLERLKTLFANAGRLLDGAQSYLNSYRYRKALAEMNGDWFKDGGFFLFKKSEEYPPPMSVVNITEYKTPESVNSFLIKERDSLQCVVGNKADVSDWVGNVPMLELTAFGMSQYPSVSEYADGLNSLEFILKNS